MTEPQVDSVYEYDSEGKLKRIEFTFDPPFGPFSRIEAVFEGPEQIGTHFRSDGEILVRTVLNTELDSLSIEWFPAAGSELRIYRQWRTDATDEMGNWTKRTLLESRDGPDKLMPVQESFREITYYE